MKKKSDASAIERPFLLFVDVISEAANHSCISNLGRAADFTRRQSSQVGLYASIAANVCVGTLYALFGKK